MANAIAAAAPQPPNFSARDLEQVSAMVQALQNVTQDLYMSQATIFLSEETDAGPVARLEIWNDGEEWAVVPLTNNLPSN